MRDYWEGRLGREQQGKGRQEGCSATRPTILAVMVTGFVSRLSLSNHSDSGLFLVAYASSVQFTSVTQSCPILCNPIGYRTPGFPVHHQLPELTQTHVHCVGDAIQPSHPLSQPSCVQCFPASGSFPMSQFFTSGGQSTVQHQSFQ